MKAHTETETREGRQTAFEYYVARYLGNTVHLFLSALALMILVAAGIAAFQILIHDFPKFWQQTNEYNALYELIQNILLVAIAAELALLLLFHRTGAAIEVVIFIIARKMVKPDITSLELLLAATALAGLIVARFYFIPQRTTQATPADDEK